MKKMILAVLATASLSTFAQETLNDKPYSYKLDFGEYLSSCVDLFRNLEVDSKTTSTGEIDGKDTREMQKTVAGLEISVTQKKNGWWAVNFQNLAEWEYIGCKTNSPVLSIDQILELVDNTSATPSEAEYGGGYCSGERYSLTSQISVYVAKGDNVCDLDLPEPYEQPEDLVMVEMVNGWKNEKFNGFNFYTDILTQEVWESEDAKVVHRYDFTGRYAHLVSGEKTTGQIEINGQAHKILFMNDDSNIAVAEGGYIFDRQSHGEDTPVIRKMSEKNFNIFNTCMKNPYDNLCDSYRRTGLFLNYFRTYNYYLEHSPVVEGDALIMTDKKDIKVNPFK